MPRDSAGSQYGKIVTEKHFGQLLIIGEIVSNVNRWADKW